MIKKQIEISREDISRFVRRGSYRIDFQFRDGADLLLDEVKQIFIDTIYTEDPELGEEVEPPKPEFSGCFYTLWAYSDAVGFAIEEDEIGTFIEVFCNMPDYYEQLVKFYLAVLEKDYPIWIKNGDEIARALKVKYSL